MTIRLTDEEVHTSIVQLYNNIALRLGYNPDNCEYDCRKINVSNDIFERIYDYYRTEENYGMDTMGMVWCCYGPKCDDKLKEYEVEIADDFIKEVVENEEN